MDTSSLVDRNYCNVDANEYRESKVYELKVKIFSPTTGIIAQSFTSKLLYWKQEIYLTSYVIFHIKQVIMKIWQSALRDLPFQHIIVHYNIYLHEKEALKLDIFWQVCKQLYMIFMKTYFSFNKIKLKLFKNAFLILYIKISQTGRYCTYECHTVVVLVKLFLKSLITKSLIKTAKSLIANC